MFLDGWDVEFFGFWDEKGHCWCVDAISEGTARARGCVPVCLSGGHDDLLRSCPKSPSSMQLYLELQRR